MNRRVAAGGAVLAIALSLFAGNARSRAVHVDGTLIYHRYSSYQAWDATMWMIDLPTGDLMQVGGDWTGVVSPINAHFSADGQMITFMGSQAGLPENEWDVFVSHWNGTSWAEPINLTGPNGARDEDPKFSPTSSTIIYKQDGVLVTMNSDGSDKKYLTQGKSESSMPYFATNGKDYLFERSGDIYVSRGGIETKMYAGDGQSSYYPIGMDATSFLYTRVQSARHDAIMKGFYSGKASERYFFNSTDWDTSDSYPYLDGSRYIFYVTGDYLIPHGGYNLAFADLKTKKRYDIDEYFRKKRTTDINTDTQELGPAWSLARFRH
ncbi:MAG: hypothetical protein F2949_00445 [Actinobacteria bacterium]|uniref:Unannotated protein n=1 Tax=freshwater metagenome TaxID=449393 RepID=A0A6J7UYM2_9ZZZZ|nr:hypothetical protein [Actinomycetota bacterium]